MRFAEVMPLVPIQGGKQELPIYTYGIPQELSQMVQPGVVVQIPIRQRLVKGLVIKLSDTKPRFALKDIKKVLMSENVISPNHLALAQAISTHYLTPLGTAIGLMLPPIHKLSFEKYYSLAQEPHQSVAFNPTQAKIIEVLSEFGTISDTDLKRRKLSASSLKTLVDNGWVKISEQVKFKEIAREPVDNISPPELTPDQEQAVAKILTSDKPNLLFGITGSGKTEVYLQVAKQMLDEDKSSIILVPEIALTPQTIDRFVSRFGKDTVAVLHSRLTGKQRFDEWQQIFRGNKKIIIGPRSALFAPVGDLGLIVIDEEHDASFKQDSSPRYHARWVACELAKHFKAKVILGSATPSLESYYAAQSGDYNLIRLPKPIFTSKAKKFVQIVNMRDERRRGNSGTFSELLILALKHTLQNKEQALLFLNRRGSKTLAICQDCGASVNCPHCDIPLVYHRDLDGRSHVLKCHHCGFAQDAILQCPICQSPRLKYVGIGTEQVESELKMLFPEARIVRFDKDTVKSHEDYERLYRLISRGEADLVVGTQMIAKGWDIPKLTTAGIVMADYGFNFPDFRTFERMFSLVTQVIGRSGRRTEPARVIIQTLTPENEILDFAVNEDYDGFANSELMLRQKLNWPPFSQVVRLIKSGKDQAQLKKNAAQMVERLMKELPQAEVNSSPAFFEKLGGEYRHQILIRGEKLSERLQGFDFENWTVDVDPVNML